MQCLKSKIPALQESYYWQRNSDEASDNTELCSGLSGHSSRETSDGQRSSWMQTVGGRLKDKPALDRTRQVWQKGPDWR